MSSEWMTLLLEHQQNSRKLLGVPGKADLSPLELIGARILYFPHPIPPALREAEREGLIEMEQVQVRGEPIGESHIYLTLKGIEAVRLA